MSTTRFNTAVNIWGAANYEELQLQQVRLLPNDETTVRSRRDVNLSREFKFVNARVSSLVMPIMAANMFGVGTLPMAEAFDRHNMLVALEKNIDVKSVVTFLESHSGRTAIPTAGLHVEDMRNISAIFAASGQNKPRFIIIDIPNGHMIDMLSVVKEYRREFPETVLIAGNVATGSMAAKIIEAGADIIKVGIGPGSACTTKLIAGIHRPQFSAIRDCAQAIHSLGGLVIGDGGIRTAGDVSIAFAAGADFAMIGGGFAGYKESGQQIFKDMHGGEWMEFMGSSSRIYMERTKGEMAQYRAAEGETQWHPYKGSIDETGSFLYEIMGGLRSALSYTGAHTLEEFSVMARAAYQGLEGLNLVKANLDATTVKTMKPDFKP